MKSWAVRFYCHYCVVLFACLLFSRLAFAQIDLPLISEMGGTIGQVKVSGDYAVIVEGSTLAVLDISDIDDPQKNGGIAMDKDITDFDLHGALAYVMADTRLEIVDLAIPAQPESIGVLPLIDIHDNVSPDRGHMVFYFEEAGVSKCFVGTTSGHHIVDVSDPANPFVLSSEPYQGISGHDVWNVGIWKNGYTYVAHDTSSETRGSRYELEITRLSDGATSAIELGFVSGCEVAISGNLLFGTTGNTLDVYDISDPLNPVNLSSDFSIGLPEFRRLKAIAVKDNLLFASSEELTPAGGLNQTILRLEIIDVTDPANLVGIQSVEAVNGIALNGATPQIAIYRDNLLHATSLGGLQISNISNPANPALIATYGGTTCYESSIKTQGNYAYSTGPLQGLQVIDISDVTAPSLAAKLENAVLSWQQTTALDISGRYAYVGGGNLDAATQQLSGGFTVVDLSDPLNPLPVSIAVSTLVPTNIAAIGNYVYTAGIDLNGNPLAIWDVSDPNNPLQVSQIPVANTSCSGLRVDPSQGRLFVGGDDGTLYIYDVSNLITPLLLGTYPLASIHSIAGPVDDYILVSAQSGTELLTISIADPSNPILVGSYDANDPRATPRKIEISGRYAYWCVGEPGFRVLDIGNPAAPFLAGTLRGWARDVDVGEVAIIMGRQSLRFVAVQPPSPDVSPQLPSFINAGSITVSGTAQAGTFVTIKGGAYPLYQQLGPNETAFSMEVALQEEAVNLISVATVNRYGLTSFPDVTQVVEGSAYPSSIESVTDLELAPASATVDLGATQSLSVAATFSNGAVSDVTPYANYLVTNNETVTSGGLYVNTELGNASITARTVNEQVASNDAIMTDGAKSFTKSALRAVAGRVYDNSTGAGLGPGTATMRAYTSYSPDVVMQQFTLDSQGNYAFLTHDGVYDFRGSSSGFRSLLSRQNRLGLPEGDQSNIPLYQREPEIDSINLDMGLRPNDSERPVIGIVEPLNGEKFGLPEIGVTAITYDRLSDLIEAIVIINEQPYNILKSISSQDFYRNVWPGKGGTNTVQIRLKDSAGNIALSPQVSVDIDSTPLEVVDAVALSPTDALITFNKSVPDSRALQADRYTITSPAKTALTVHFVTRISDTQLLLSTDTQAAGTSYSMSVFGVGDAYGNLIKVLTTVSFPGYDTSGDQDADGLANTVETGTGAFVDATNTGTFSNNPDSDGDTLPDGWEVQEGLNPTSAAGDDGKDADPDSDGLTNAHEHANRTHPLTADSDGDGVNDGQELTNGTSPNLPQTFDSDADGMPDDYEDNIVGLDPNLNDASRDLDNDGLTNIQEFRLGTNPIVADTDGDNLSDGQETNRYGTDPLVADTDGDTVSDGAEIAAGSDPLVDSHVRLAITRPADGTTLHGNHVTLSASITSGNANDLAEVTFQIRNAGTTDPFVDITPAGGSNPVEEAPYVLAWDADTMGAGLYELRAVGISKASLVDSVPESTTLQIDPNATYAEYQNDLHQTLTVPVFAGMQNELAVADMERGITVRVNLPEGALNADGQMTVQILDGAGVNPILSNELATGIYVSLTLDGASLALAQGEYVTIILGYPDANIDGVLDGSDISADLLKLKYLNPNTNRFQNVVSSDAQPLSRQVVSMTDHFSVFGLVADGGVAPPTIVLPSVPSAQVSQYFALSLVATGGAAPYAWKTTIGSLPPGLSLVGSEISGLPSQAGSYTFGIQVNDARMPSSIDTQSVTINVESSTSIPPPPSGTPLSSWPLLVLIPIIGRYILLKRRISSR